MNYSIFLYRNQSYIESVCLLIFNLWFLESFPFRITKLEHGKTPQSSIQLSSKFQNYTRDLLSDHLIFKFCFIIC